MKNLIPNQLTQYIKLPDPPVPTTQEEGTLFVPSSKYSEPKSTPGGEFVEKETRKNYKGYYIEVAGGTFLAGKSPEDKGVALEKISKLGNALERLSPIALSLLASIFKQLYKPKLTSGEVKAGVANRYFVQDKLTNKIAETDQESYEQATQLPTVRTAKVDWDIKGPANDQMINGYPYEGAASKNKKAIQALESQMPGISTFVTNYSELVEEPVIIKDIASDIQTTVVEDPVTELDNIRKANFDLKK